MALGYSVLTNNQGKFRRGKSANEAILLKPHFGCGHDIVSWMCINTSW